MSKPPGYYMDWSYEQRRDYDAREREREDLECRRQEAQEALERQQQKERELRREYRNEMESAHEQRMSLAEEIRAVKRELYRAMQFIAEKGLTKEFEDWEEPDDEEDDES